MNSLRIKGFTSQDLVGIKHLQPADWPDILPEFKFYVSWPYCFPVKALLDGKVVGVGASIVLGKTGWLGHIIVAPEYRYRGIGYRIVEKLLKDLDSRGIRTCSLVATQLGKNIYAKLGFRDIGEYLFFKREGEGRHYSPDVNLRPVASTHVKKIHEMDQRISGEDRKKLLEMYLSGSTVYTKDSEVLGYYIPGFKEGLIIADSEAAGIALMKMKHVEIHKATLPSENKAGIQFLEENGFSRIERTGIRMERGKDLIWRPDKIYGRIGGNLG